MHLITSDKGIDYFSLSIKPTLAKNTFCIANARFMDE